MNQTTTRADNPGLNPPHETLGVEEKRAAQEVPGQGESRKPGLADAPKEWEKTGLRPAPGRMTLAPLSVVEADIPS